jgi:membrane protein involved in colicin uptake
LAGENKLKTILFSLLIWSAFVASAEARKVTVGVPVLDVTQSALYVENQKADSLSFHSSE